ncbi:hypothetical protein K2O51_31600 (plasmid) [Cupriavidus pinatubonensis]|uniref:hypothetical protein n=1 Tax=Cupriavidus pinatubonensis TaxID=248026 RepID=UPI001C73AD39|nr:hypothetical protein [Cupriavidus pinatubonensis]QYY33575.1 hypothetical protein K2O51_31600 [Cupriavidus pinatubonensis]
MQDGRNAFVSLQKRLVPFQKEMTHAKFNVWAVPLADKSRAFCLEQVIRDYQGLVWLRGGGEGSVFMTHYAEGAYQFELRKVAETGVQVEVDFREG